MVWSGRGGLITIDQSNKILYKIVISLFGVATRYPIRLVDRVHTKKDILYEQSPQLGEKNRKDENKFFNV